MRATIRDNQQIEPCNAIAYTQKKRTDQLDMLTIGNLFVGDSSDRKSSFGIFKATDIQKKNVQKDQCTQKKNLSQYIVVKY